MTAPSQARRPRWATHLVSFGLAAAASTAFLMHLGAVDPWTGGIVVPATLWAAWTAVAIARAPRRPTRQMQKRAD